MPQTALTKPGLSRVSLIFACGTALLSDGYSNNVMGVVVTLLGEKYGTANVAAHNFSTILTSVTFAGIVVGQLSFGYISDKVGRKFGMMSATAIVAVFALLSSTVKGVDGNLRSMLSQLAVWRFMIGIGLGAEYPCGSVAASEQSEEPGIKSHTQHRWLALSTITMINTGFVIGTFVPLVLLWIFGPDRLNAVWRGSLGLGMVPAVLVFIWRLRMDEPTRYKRDSMKRVRIPYRLVIRRYWARLAAISVTWFLFDFIVYPFGLFSSSVITAINPNPSLVQNLALTVVISLLGLPGTILGSFAVDWLGPKNTQILGCVCQAIVGFIMSGAYRHLVTNAAAFAVVYGIFQSLGEFGTGVCTIVLSAKSGPTAVRGQFYGVAAATGKIGAFVGIWIFKPLIAAFSHHGADPDRGNIGPFWIASGIALLNALITYFFVHPLTHDGMEREDAEFRVYLEAHGWDTSKMGLLTDEEIRSIEEKAAEREQSDGNSVEVIEEKEDV